MKNYLFFDTETTGVPKDYRAPAIEWPRMVQLAWLMHNEKREVIDSGNLIIKPEGFKIPKAAADIHGITNEIALGRGMGLEGVLKVFKERLDTAKYIIGHNVSFDRKILRGELIRKEIEYDSSEKIKICTMMLSTKYCAIPNKFGFKWPKLQELHEKLFGEEFEGAHDASADIKATARCFWKLIDLEVIKLSK